MMTMKQEIENFIELLNELQKIDPEFPLQYARCLSEIALNEGLSMTELAEKTGMPLSTISRITASLSKQRSRGKHYDLLRINVSPTERRKKQIFLNKKGHQVVDNISKIVVSGKR